MANGRCYHHGGPTPKGVASPNWKHGRYSKYLPTRYLDRYMEGVNDPELNSLKQEAAVTIVRMSELFQRIDSGESGHLYRQMKKEKVQFQKASKEKRLDAAKEHLEEILRLIDHGLGDWAIWDEIRATMEQHRKLVESERKRLVEMHQLITMDEGLALIRFIEGLIKEHVSDKREVAAISEQLAVALNRSPISRIESG